MSLKLNQMPTDKDVSFSMNVTTSGTHCDLVDIIVEQVLIVEIVRGQGRRMSFRALNSIVRFYLPSQPISHVSGKLLITDQDVTIDSLLQNDGNVSHTLDGFAYETGFTFQALDWEDSAWDDPPSPLDMATIPSFSSTRCLTMTTCLLCCLQFVVLVVQDQHQAQHEVTFHSLLLRVSYGDE